MMKDELKNNLVLSTQNSPEALMCEFAANEKHLSQIPTLLLQRHLSLKTFLQTDRLMVWRGLMSYYMKLKE